MDTDSEFGVEHPIRREPYQQTRFEYLFAHILSGLVSGQAPKNREKVIDEAYALADLAEQRMKARRNVD